MVLQIIYFICIIVRKMELIFKRMTFIMFDVLNILLNNYFR